MSDPDDLPRVTAAFVRVEELLLPGRDVAAAAYVAASAPGLVERAGRLAALAVTLPALGIAGWRDRRLRRRLSALHLRGLSRDRIETLLREHHERFVAGRVRDEGRAAVERARAQGHEVLLVSSGLRDALVPLAAELGAAALVADELEYRDGLATGKVLSARGDGWLAALAKERRLSLEGSWAYGADADDLPLLRAVGYPCVVNPDARLRRAALAAGWPALEVR